MRGIVPIELWMLIELRSADYASVPSPRSAGRLLWQHEDCLICTCPDEIHQKTCYFFIFRDSFSEFIHFTSVKVSREKASKFSLWAQSNKTSNKRKSLDQVAISYLLSIFLDGAISWRTSAINWNLLASSSQTRQWNSQIGWNRCYLAGTHSAYRAIGWFILLMT